MSRSRINSVFPLRMPQVCHNTIKLPSAMSSSAAHSSSISKRIMSTERDNGHIKWGCNCLLCSNISSYSNISLDKLSTNGSRKALFSDKASALHDDHPLPYKFSDADDEDSHHIDNILANNRQWVEDMKRDNPDEFKKLGMNQTPKYLYFGCSDSRVPANRILGLGPGEVFVHRNVGNLVPGNDLNSLSVIEFAVEHLGVTDIIVTGHYNCGAVKAAVTKQDLGMLENWLRLIRDVYRLHRDYLDSIGSDEDRHKRLVELNVVEQCINIYKTGIVQRKRLQNRKSRDKNLHNAPRIHGLVFDTSEGLLKRLEVDFMNNVGSLDEIYALY